MKTCSLYEASYATLNVQEIVDDIELNGLVGIHGGRLETSKAMKKISNFIEEYNDDEFCEEKINIYPPLAIDHPETNLGYLFNEDKYDHDMAKNIVNKSYDLELAR